MGVRTRHEIPEDTYILIAEATRAYCESIVIDPTRGNYVKPKRIKENIAAQFPEDITSERVRGRLVGSILQDAAYAEKWSNRETYRLDESEF